MWIARDKDGRLGLCTRTPRPPQRCIDEGYWRFASIDYGVGIPCELFPELTWEDEPLEVNIVESSLDKKVNNSCSAESLIRYLNERECDDKYLSNIECKEIDDAYKNNDWETIIKYIQKYTIYR